MTGIPLSLSALAALLPIAVFSWRQPQGGTALFWLLLGAAAAGPLTLALAHLRSGWPTDLASALWISIAATLLAFAALAALRPEARRLAPLLAPYLLGMGLAAILLERAARASPPLAAPAAWLDAHIAISIATYALLTLAAIAALAAFLQERALKGKKRSRLAELLPSVADAEGLQLRLLAVAGGVLALGVLSGAATQYLASRTAIEINHKTLFSFAALGVIALLLLLHRRTGLRGRRAAQLALLAYLLLTLAYPGVKFVTDVLLS